jgi:hypothetical protein
MLPIRSPGPVRSWFPSKTVCTAERKPMPYLYVTQCKYQTLNEISLHLRKYSEVPISNGSREKE